MFNDLTALGYGLVMFAIIIGVGVVVIGSFAETVANCPSGHPQYNATSQLCQVTGNGTNTTGASAATDNSNYLIDELGEDGLAGWTPAIVAIAVGLLFLGVFMLKSGRKGRY